GLTDAGLVAVHLGGVDVAVADLERFEDAVARGFRRHLPGAEAELGNGDAVVQGDGEHGSHANAVHHAGPAEPRSTPPSLDPRHSAPEPSSPGAQSSPRISTPAACSVRYGLMALP